MKKHPFQKGIEKSNEELIDTSLGGYRNSKEKSIPNKGKKEKKPKLCC